MNGGGTFSSLSKSIVVSALEDMQASWMWTVRIVEKMTRWRLSSWCVLRFFQYEGNSNRCDRQAETLKYLYLLFSDDTVVPLNGKC